MSIKIASQGKFKVIKATQDLTNPKILFMLQNMVNTLIGQGETHFVMDLSEVKDVDTALLGVVSEIRQRIRDKNAELNIVLGGVAKVEMLNLSGLGESLRVYQTFADFDRDIQGDSFEEPRKVNSTSPMYEIFEKGEYHVIRFRHEIKNYKFVEELKKATLKLVKEGVVNFVLDFRGLKSVSSVILGYVAGLNDKIKKASGRIHVIADSPDIQELFNITSLTNFLHVFSSKDAFLSQLKGTTYSLQQDHIILADPASSSRAVLKKRLQDIGYAVSTAEESKLLIEKVMSVRPDLVVLDIRISDVFEVCKKIKQNTEKGKPLPVIFILSSNKTEERKLALEAGGDDFILPSISDEELVLKFRIHLTSVRSARELEKLGRSFDSQVNEKYEALADKERQLMQAEKMSMISTFLTGAAHELKNPLFVISGWTQMMKRKGALSPEQQKCLDYITDSTFRCIGIVENLLNLTRTTLAKSKNLDLNAIVKNSIEKLDYQIKDHGAVVQLELARFAKVTASASEMEQVVVHLLGNALDAVAGKPGVIAFKTGEEGSAVFLQVVDNGTGMVEEVRQKMFDPFFTTKEVGKGTGLGLTIVKRIVDSHRGQISVESAPGQGTTVTITLPRPGTGNEA